MKPFREISELIALLEHRGLNVDSVDATAFLHDCNYYRFTGYSRQYQVNPGAKIDTYLPGSSLSRIRALMTLDSAFRAMLSTALGRVELSVRARFAHESGRVLGEEAFYLDPDNYHAATPGLGALIDSMIGDLARTKSPTVLRYKTGLTFDKVPIWVAVEVLSFGSIAKMIQYLANDAPGKAVAASYSLPWEGFQSTVHSFAVLRNRCAHHGQIWHRRLDIHCPVPKRLRPRSVVYNDQGPYSAVLMLRRYLKEIDPTGTWGADVDALLGSDKDYEAGILKPFAK